MVRRHVGGELHPQLDGMGIARVDLAGVAEPKIVTRFCGVTALEGVDSGPVPIALVALTVNV